MVPVIAMLFTLALPAFVIWRSGQKKPLRRPYLLSVGSFAFCTIAAIEELYAVKERLLAGDTGGIADTIDAALVLCIVLLVVAVILNLLALWRSHEDAKNNQNS